MAPPTTSPAAGPAVPATEQARATAPEAAAAAAAASGASDGSAAAEGTAGNAAGAVAGDVAEDVAGDVAELADALVRAMKRMRRETAARLEPIGITPGQSRALRVLAHAAECGGDGRPLRLSELADRLNIAPRSATTVVDALEAAGLVERTPDQADRRAVGLRLTGGGRQAMERIGRVRQEVAEEYFAAVGPEDRQALLRVLADAESTYAARSGRPSAHRCGGGRA